MAQSFYDKNSGFSSIGLYSSYVCLVTAGYFLYLCLIKASESVYRSVILEFMIIENMVFW